jgi:hypothetical protein
VGRAHLDGCLLLAILAMAMVAASFIASFTQRARQSSAPRKMYGNAHTLLICRGGQQGSDAPTGCFVREVAGAHAGGGLSTTVACSDTTLLERAQSGFSTSRQEVPNFRGPFAENGPCCVYVVRHPEACGVHPLGGTGCCTGCSCAGWSALVRRLAWRLKGGAPIFKFRNNAQLVAQLAASLSPLGLIGPK